MQNNHSLKKSDASAEQLDLQYAESYYADGYYGSTVAEATEKQKLFRFLAVLRKYWMLVAATTIVVTTLVIIYEARKPDYYKANARIQVNNEMNPPGGEGGGSSPIILSQGNDPAYFTTQLQILEGSGLIRRVVKTLDLEYNDAFTNPGAGDAGLAQNVLRMFGLSKAEAAASTSIKKPAENKLNIATGTEVDLDAQAEKLAPYVDTVRKGLTVEPVTDSRTVRGETRLIEVEFTHKDPAIAAKVANAIADVYVLQNLERKVETNASASDFLQKRVAELQSEIRSGEERLINYAKSNQILSLDATQNTVVQRLTDLNIKLAAAENDRITAEAAFRAASQNPMRDSSAQTKDTRTAALETQLTALRQRVEQLTVEYTEEWPEVKQARRQIAAIESELATNKKRSADIEVAGLEQAYRQAAAREKELRANFDQQRGAVLSQNEAAINYRILQQEIDTNKSLLNNLLQQTRETEVILNGTPNNVSVVDRALVPRSPAGPQRTKNVLVALVVSLIAGLGLAFVIDWLDDTVKTADTIELQLGSPVIGLIPSTGKRLSQRLLPAKLMRNGHKKSAKNIYQLDAFNKPVVAEAFHQLRTSLLLSTAGGAPETILITSSQPAEGKTVTSLNLAKSLAQTSSGRVLLIDADLRCPKLHSLNNLSNTSGLSSLLTTKKADENLITSIVNEDIEVNLDLLTAGPSVPNPANLFASNEMRALLVTLKRMYSHVIIDSPPLLYFADSVILAASVDAVILMARANVSSHDMLARATKKLRDVRGNLVGVVLNDLPLAGYEYYNSAYYAKPDTFETDEATGSMLRLG